MISNLFSNFNLKKKLILLEILIEGSSEDKEIKEQIKLYRIRLKVTIRRKRSLVEFHLHIFNLSKNILSK